MHRLLCALVLVAAPATAQDYITFQSPSGNIACAVFSGDYTGARCDIREVSSLSYARPASCDLDFGQAFEVQPTGAAVPICHGDTVADPGAPVLGYGQSFSRNGITCTSQRSGMTCRNRAGHGFSLARARQQAF